MDNREKLIKELTENEIIDKDSIIFIIEHKKISSQVAFLRFEVLDNKKKSLFLFKIQVDIDEKLAKMKNGEIKTQVGLFKLQSKSFFSTLKGGIDSAISDGRLPFFPK